MYMNLSVKEVISYQIIIIKIMGCSLSITNIKGINLYIIDIKVYFKYLIYLYYHISYLNKRLFNSLKIVVFVKKSVISLLILLNKSVIA